MDLLHQKEIEEDEKISGLKQQNKDLKDHLRKLKKNNIMVMN